MLNGSRAPEAATVYALGGENGARRVNIAVLLLDAVKGRSINPSNSRSTFGFGFWLDKLKNWNFWA
jgi:hypothetical protein